jgi:hypothetical protein
MGERVEWRLFLRARASPSLCPEATGALSCHASLRSGSSALASRRLGSARFRDLVAAERGATSPHGLPEEQREKQGSAPLLSSRARAEMGEIRRQWRRTWWLLKHGREVRRGEWGEGGAGV